MKSSAQLQFDKWDAGSSETSGHVVIGFAVFHDSAMCRDAVGRGARLPARSDALEDDLSECFLVAQAP